MNYSISAGGNHSLILKNGVVYSCGRNNFGQLGTGTIDDEFLFTKVLDNISQNFKNENITAISAGEKHSLIIRNGFIYSCGNNEYGQLGIGNVGQENLFTKVLDNIDFENNNVAAISAGESHSLILKNGVVYGCGYNFYGQLGIGSNSNQETIFTKVLDNGDFQNNNVTTISAGFYHSLILNNGIV